MELDRNGLEVLDRDECLRLLAQSTLGRLGLSCGALPTVLPVNFRLDGERILIGTGKGTKLDAATHNAVVAFEVDDFDPMYHSGWSVVVTGVAREVGDADERASLPPMPHWARRDEVRVMAIDVDMVSGRRLRSGGGNRAGTARFPPPERDRSRGARWWRSWDRGHGPD